MSTENRGVKSITFDEGKYIVVCNPIDIPREVCRYGEPWRDILGDSFISTMIGEIASARDVLNAVAVV